MKGIGEHIQGDKAQAFQAANAAARARLSSTLAEERERKKRQTARRRRVTPLEVLLLKPIVHHSQIDRVDFSRLD